MAKRPDKYTLYQMAVQSPKTHVSLFEELYRREFGGRDARRLREDFCGTFAISCAWVNSGDARSAMAVDLSTEPLKFGKQNNLVTLPRVARKRVRIVRGDVLKVKTPPADLIAACNFSFYIFKERRTLLRYFQATRRSLASPGLLVLEMAGGPGMIETMKERKSVRRKGVPPFTYIWDQQSFDPITRDAKYAIHFQLKNGPLMKDAFTYDWRLWTIPEVRELLTEAGFRKVMVLWEVEDKKGKGTNEFAPSNKGSNDYSWCAYVVAVR